MSQAVDTTPIPSLGQAGVDPYSIPLDKIDVSDPVSSLSHQFLGSAPPAPPGKVACGVDPTADANGIDLGCADYPAELCQ